jgi:hypothetical protein
MGDVEVTLTLPVCKVNSLVSRFGHTSDEPAAETGFKMTGLNIPTVNRTPPVQSATRQY